jgi:hypothetical protein
VCVCAKGSTLMPVDSDQACTSLAQRAKRAHAEGTSALGLATLTVDHQVELLTVELERTRVVGQIDEFASTEAEVEIHSLQECVWRLLPEQLLTALSCLAHTIVGPWVERWRGGWESCVVG